MNIADIITIIIAGAGLITALSLIYGKFITPIKKVVKQVEENTEQVKYLENKIAKIKIERDEEIEFDTAVRSLLLESLIAVLDGLEQVGANHSVSEQKKNLISFMSKQVSGK